jgi:uncharacterized protein
MSYYLALNPRFTDAERALGIVGLAKVADRFAGPGFKCADAHTATERTICGSETLRIFDAEIGRAFQALRAKEGAALLGEQRLWLQNRDRSCTGAEVVTCLAEVMRTRIRCLHYRLSESSAVAVKSP